MLIRGFLKYIVSLLMLFYVSGCDQETSFTEQPAKLPPSEADQEADDSGRIGENTDEGALPQEEAGHPSNGQESINATIKDIPNEDPKLLNANDQVFNTLEDTPLTGMLYLTNAAGKSLSFEITEPAAFGEVQISDSGAITYTPDADAFGKDSIQYMVTADNGESSSAKVTINVDGLNDLPILNNQVLTLLEDTPAMGQIMASDIDNDPLTYEALSNAQKGTLVIDAVSGAIQFTPHANVNGTDMVSIRVKDGDGSSEIKTLTINISPVNDAPVASNVNYMTNEDMAFSGNLVGSDIENSTLTYELLSAPGMGMLVITDANAGTFNYSPPLNATGTVSVTYRVYDGSAYSAPATLQIDVTPVSDDPIALNGSYTTAEDTSLNGQLNAIDVDGTGGLSYQIVSAPNHGSVSVTASTGAFVYTPIQNYYGQDSFTFHVLQGTNISNVATVTITVTPVNDAPVAYDGSTNAYAGAAAITINLMASDVDMDTLTYAVVSNPSYGTIQSLDTNTGILQYLPDATYTGQTSFDFRVSDGFLLSNIATITITLEEQPYFNDCDNPQLELPVVANGYDVVDFLGINHPQFLELNFPVAKADPATYHMAEFCMANFDIPDTDFDDGFPVDDPNLNQDEWYAIEAVTNIILPVAGTYHFRIKSDDGANVYFVNTNLDVCDQAANAYCIDNDGVHAVTTVSREMYFDAGVVPLRIDWFQGPALKIQWQLFWKKPGDTDYSIVPTEALSRN